MHCDHETDVSTCKPKQPRLQKTTFLCYSSRSRAGVICYFGVSPLVRNVQGTWRALLLNPLSREPTTALPKCFRAIHNQRQETKALTCSVPRRRMSLTVSSPWQCLPSAASSNFSADTLAAVSLLARKLDLLLLRADHIRPPAESKQQACWCRSDEQRPRLWLPLHGDSRDSQIWIVSPLAVHSMMVLVHSASEALYWPILHDGQVADGGGGRDLVRCFVEVRRTVGAVC